MASSIKQRKRKRPHLPAVATADSGLSVPQLKARLGNLAGEAGERAFERVKLAAELLGRREFLEEFQGDDLRARHYLEERFLGDLCGAVSLGQMLAIYARFPDVEQWRARRFQLRRLWADELEARAHEQAEKKGPPREKKPREYSRPTVQDILDRDQAIMAKDQEIQKAAATLERTEKALADKDQEIARLRARVAELERQLAEMTGENRELRRQLAAGASVAA